MNKKTIITYIPTRLSLRLSAMACAAVLTLPVCAQSTVKDRDQNLMNMTSEGWEWEINAGLNVGGAAPLGMPREVRKVKKYNPWFNTSLEGKVTKWWDANRHWGSSVGLRFENKSMEVNADVKNYHTEIIRDGDRVSGYWTGFVNIKYDATYLTIPITADYRFNDRWKINAGPFISWRYDGSFSGYVTDGYLRSGIPTGEKIVYEKGQQATYEFDNDLRRFTWGAQIGGSWRAYRHFSVNVNVTYVFNNIFKKGFTTVQNTLHPVYGNIGFGYSF